MIEKMQTLALCFLWKELEGNKHPPNDLKKWFVEEKEKDPGRFFSYLVEPSGKIERFYTLSPDIADRNTAILESAEIGSLGNSAAVRLPFNKPAGAQSPQIGPVIKRSYSKEKGAGPSLKILKSTLKAFEEKSQSDSKWSSYFSEVTEVFIRKKIKYSGQERECAINALHEAIDVIPETKPVFLVYKNKEGQLPGDSIQYKQYLSSMLDADNKYTTIKAIAHKLEECPCCSAKDIRAYAAGISKAGINIFNIDREGAFPNITNENAHLSFAICENCADLLYIFKFHVSETYLTQVSGQEVMLLPEIYSQTQVISGFINSYQTYIELLNRTPEKAIIKEKKRLSRILANEKAVCAIDVIWSKDSLRGQSIHNLNGHISDVLPSRLRLIDEKNKKFNKANPLFPRHIADQFDFDLSLTFVNTLFHRRGGKAATKINASQKLVVLKRQIAECVYKGLDIPGIRLWEEIMITAGWWVRYLLKSNENNIEPAFEMIREGFSEKKNYVWMTFAGWIKHLFMALCYFN